MQQIGSFCRQNAKNTGILASVSNKMSTFASSLETILA
jgi:hypothetical protein